jgi:3-hydroxyisobutyrate dehydrogenase-like beta-hydroxyacid dehydrogenase
LKLSTKPALTGSPPIVNAIGIAAVASFAARGEGSPPTAVMTWAVAEQSDIVLSIVTDAAAVKAVALGAEGVISGLRKGGIYIDMSTIDRPGFP